MTDAPASGPMLCASCASTRKAHAPVVKRSGTRSNPDTIARRRVAQRFYSSPRWRQVRDAVRRRDGECLECGTRRDLTVDHVIPRSVAPQLAYHPENLRTLCRRCHGRKDGARAAAATARTRALKTAQEHLSILREGNDAREGSEPSRSPYGISTPDAMDTERDPVVG
jgi:5-methylcytosine-specific restriction endonuclease McrA